MNNGKTRIGMNRDHTNLNRNMPASDDLAWQCDRLLLGELSSTEVDQLNERFADDQFAREALAEEVLLLGTLAQLEAADFVAPAQCASATSAKGNQFEPAWTRSVTWLASVALACCLLLAAMVANQWAARDNNSTTSEVVKNPAIDSLDELAGFWSENQELYESLALVDISTEYAPRQHDLDADELAPEWMLAAVEAESGEPLRSDALPGEDEQWQ